MKIRRIETENKIFALFYQTDDLFLNVKLTQTHIKDMCLCYERMPHEIKMILGNDEGWKK